MHESFLLGQVFWNFLILFSFIWIMLFTLEPDIVKTDLVFSKMKCSWFAFAIAIFIVLILWLVFYIIRWSQTRSEINRMIQKLRGIDTPNARKLDKELKKTKGRTPLEKLENLMNKNNN